MSPLIVFLKKKRREAISLLLFAVITAAAYYFWIKWLMIFAGLIAWFIAAALWDGFRKEQELRKWFVENEGRLILFFPAQKIMQEFIESKIVPGLKEDLLLIHYEGPLLTGDVKTWIARKLRIDYSLELNKPMLMLIRNGRLVIGDVSHEIEDAFLEKGPADKSLAGIRQKIEMLRKA